MDLWFSLLIATKSLKQPLEAVLKEMSQAGCLPICVISDFFLGWTVETCQLFGVPRIVFHGMGVLPMVIAKTAYMHIPSIMGLSYSDSIQLPELTIPFTLNRIDFPDLNRPIDFAGAFQSFISEVGEAEAKSWGIIVNSFEGLDGEYREAFESFYPSAVKSWCVGPFLLHNNVGQSVQIDESHPGNQSCPYMKWLDRQHKPVIYISFGTQADVSDIQMDEIAFGLDIAGQPFIWAVRSSTWAPPDGWEERVKERGLVVREWVDQRSILSHPAIGGFLSHCGWNSVLESLSSGVPILAWPLGAEQPLNAKFVVDVLGAGLHVSIQSVGGERMVTVGRELICEGVKGLMEGGEMGKKVREKARVLTSSARKAVAKGGSSDKRLDELIQSLVSHKKSEVDDVFI